MLPAILKAIPYFAVWLLATAGVASPSTKTKVVQQSQSETTNKSNSVVYINRTYGFRLTLPETWRGYSITVGEWTGSGGCADQSGEVPLLEKGPLISIVHPFSTKAHPRQNIPIMIFTRDQWHLIQECKLSVSAAPFPPGELGRNGKYVFALPPRYNYAFLTGWEEVDEIMKHNPLHAF